MRCFGEADIELGGGGVWYHPVGLKETGHGHGAAGVLDRRSLVGNRVADRRPADELGVAGLDDESRLHAVEGHAVVEVGFDEVQEVGDGDRGGRAVQLERDSPFLGVEEDAGFPGLLGGRYLLLGGRSKRGRLLCRIGPSGCALQRVSARGENGDTGENGQGAHQALLFLAAIPFRGAQTHSRHLVSPTKRFTVSL